ncbi:MAG: hypothetical protein IPP79_04950 [Chitinophagaceae bacterium]|nr:hypothetical protein [Chitinophagaceae bacterium]
MIQNKRNQNKYSLIFFLIITIFSCNSEQLRYNEIIIDKEVVKGKTIEDSVFHGAVEFYDITNSKYKGHSYYKFGKEIGPLVRFQNLQQKDSFVFELNTKSGIEYLIDSNRLYYSANLFDGRVVGPVIEYDRSEKPLKYYFYNFEGNLIYQATYSDSGWYEKGSVFNFSINDQMRNDKLQKTLFLYLIKQPNNLGYYELAVLNEKKEIIQAKELESAKFYVETKLETVAKEKHYAIVYHYSRNSGNQRILIQELFLEF